MVVGVSRFVIGLPGVSSLKAKRSVVRRIVDRTSGRFNAAVAEVGSLDVHQRAELGVAVISNEAAHCHRMLEEIAKYVESLHESGLESRTTEILHARADVRSGADVLDRWDDFADGEDVA